MNKILKVSAVIALISIALTACGTPPKAPEKKPAAVVQEAPEEKPAQEAPAPVAKTKTPEEPAEVPVKKYTVVKGDTLSQIALKFYGTRERAYYFPIIMAMNPGVVKHPDKLQPKMVLLIPDFDKFMQHSPSKRKAKPEFGTCIKIYEREERFGIAKALQRRVKTL